MLEFQRTRLPPEGPQPLQVLFNIICQALTHNNACSPDLHFIERKETCRMHLLVLYAF